jgi:hypothetical protein
MKRKREELRKWECKAQKKEEQEQEEKEQEELSIKQQNRRMSLILDVLPDDLLGVIVQYLGLLEKHILRFVCKRTHRIIHNISSSLLMEFHNPRGIDTLAAKCGSVKIFGWVLETLKMDRGEATTCGWSLYCSRNVYHVAAKYNHLDIMKIAKSHGYPYSGSVWYFAAKNKNLKMLKWLGENEYPWSESDCMTAAGEGNLDILKWLREHKCPWNEQTCANAASNGHLDILKWALENNCCYDEWTCLGAAREGHLDVLKWTMKNCVFLDPDNWMCDEAASGSFRDIKMGKRMWFSFG